MTQPLVSVIILTFDGIEYIDECLSSVLRQTYPNTEVIVIDNNSKDGTADLVEQQFPSVILARNSSNMGFAAGNNVGMRKARGAYVVLLNQDTRVDPHWIEELVNVAEQDERIGICASKLLSMNDPTIINDSGQLISPDLITWRRGIGEIDAGQYDHREEVFGASAAAAFYRKGMLNEIGLFDEDYFIMREGDELNLKAGFAGWKCVYVPTAIVYHIHSATTGLYSPLKLYYGERNRIWNVVKFLPLPLIISSSFFTCRRYVAMGLFALTSHKKKARVVRRHSLMRLGFSLARAWIDASRGLPKTLAKRRRIQRTKKLSNQEIRDWLKRYSATLRDVVER